MRILLLILAVTSLAVAQDDEVCRVLALSGGGNKGAYEAAVAYELAHNLPVEERNWNVVTGVSAGSLNTLFMSGFEAGDEVAMTEYVLDVLENLTTQDIWVLWPEGLIKSFLGEQGIFDDAPMLATLQEYALPLGDIKKKVVVGTVNTTNGVYKTYDESLTIEQFSHASVSSSSIPGVFPPHHFDNGIYMDGGTVWNLLIESGVEKCREEVDSDEKIVVDVIICGHVEALESTTTTNTLDNLLRQREIKKYYSALDDVYEYLHTVPNVQLRYFFSPSEELTSGLQMLLVTPEIIEPMVEIGKADADRVLAQEAGYGFNKLKAWKESPTLQAEYPRFNDFLYAGI